LGLTKTSSALSTIGQATNLPQGRIGKVYQYADNLTWIKGKHSFTFGGEYKVLDTLAPFLPNFDGSYSFNSQQRIANNAPSALSVTVGDPLLHFKEHDQYYFVQDDFKFRSNITLNLGARYEFTGQPINILHDISVQRESNPATALFNPALPIAARTNPKIPSDYNNIAPRVGFAYTPHFWKKIFGEDTTVFRGGFSIAYDAAFYNILLNVDNAAPFAAALTVPTGSLPTSGSAGALPNNPNGTAVRAAAAASGLLPRGVLNPIFLTQTTVANNFRAPYAEQWSLGMQHQFGKKQILDVRYVGTHGVGLFQSVNGNFVAGPIVNGFFLSHNTSSNSNTIQTAAGCAAATGANVCLNFPSLPGSFPAGTTPQVCVDNPATLDLENACNNRLLPQGSLTVRQNSSQSIYHALQVDYHGRFLKDTLSLGASYSFSKTIDDSSEIFAFNDVSSPNAQNPLCINRCERSISDLNRPHAFSTNFVFDIPIMKDQHGFVGHILGGWQLNGTYILTSGAPYTPADGINLGLNASYLSAGDRPFIGNVNAPVGTVGISQLDAFYFFNVPCNPSPCTMSNTGFWSFNALNTTGVSTAVTPNDVHFILNGPGSAKTFGTPYGTSPRNSLVGPILNQANLSLFKNIRVTERLNLQLRGEAFNFLNHPNPGVGTGSGGFLPNINVSNAGVAGSAFANPGDITYARRVIQVGLRIAF
jgi:hypothetical protein